MGMILVAFFFLLFDTICVWTANAGGHGSSGRGGAEAGTMESGCAVFWGAWNRTHSCSCCVCRWQNSRSSQEGLSELRRWTNPYRKCQSKVWCFTGDIPREQISQHNVYRLCLGEEEITGNYRSINWSTIKGEFLE